MRHTVPDGALLRQVDNHRNIIVADTGNHAIRRVAPDGTVSTVAGNGSAGFADGVGGNARFNSPIDVAVDGAGNIYVVDARNNALRRIAMDGTVTSLGTVRPSRIRQQNFGFTTENSYAPGAVVASGNLLFVAGSNGVFVSRDSGATFDPGPNNGFTPTDIAIADLNGDGFLDVAQVFGLGGSIWAYLATSPSTFGPPVRTTFANIETDARALTLSRLNNDVMTDAVICLGSNLALRFFRGSGDGTFNSDSFVRVSSTSTGIAVTDVDRDGIQDIAIATQASEFHGIEIVPDEIIANNN